MLVYNGAMLAAVDVHYLSTHAFAACVLFHAFTDAHEIDTRVVRVIDIAPYEPGAFYKRELPCLLAVLNTAGGGLETVVIDGYVWLSADGKPASEPGSSRRSTAASRWSAWRRTRLQVLPMESPCCAARASCRSS